MWHRQNAMPGRACSLHTLVCGSHYHHFNKCGYAEVFMPSKCLMQMHNLLLTHASFLPSPEYFKAALRWWEELYVKQPLSFKRRCLNPFVLWSRYSAFSFYPMKDQLFFFLFAGCFGLSLRLMVSQAVQKTP